MYRAPVLPLLFACLLALGSQAAFAQEDLTPPTLLDVQFDPQTIDTSRGPATITVTVHVTDDLSGMRWVGLFFAKPGTTQRAQIEFRPDEGWSDTVSETKQYLPPGTGAWLTEWRAERNMTKREFSEMTGINHTTLLAYERGDYAPSRTTAQRIKDSIEQPQSLLDAPLDWVRIDEIARHEQPEMIYAFQVEPHHNFVCGTGPLISHNCETFAAGTQFFWSLVLDDVTEVEFDAFCVALAEFAAQPYIGAKSNVGLGRVQVRFNHWHTVDARANGKRGGWPKGRPRK